jgi:hypothetical protein
VTAVDWALVIALLAGWAGRETLFLWRRRKRRER